MLHHLQVCESRKGEQAMGGNSQQKLNETRKRIGGIIANREYLPFHLFKNKQSEGVSITVHLSLLQWG